MFKDKRLLCQIFGNQSDLCGRHSQGGRGLSYSGGGRSHNQFNTFNKPLCQICDKAGHTALKCFYRFDLRYQNSVSNQTATSSEISSDESPAAIHNSQAYIASPNIVNDTAWYLDSGATHHVTADGQSMATKSEYTGNGKLFLGDGSQLLISHIGHMSLPTSQSLKLKNILLVPSTTKNLISISKFTLENDVIEEFDSTCCYIKDKKSKVVLLQGMLKNGLYQLLLPSCGKLSQKSSCNLNLVSS